MDRRLLQRELGETVKNEANKLKRLRERPAKVPHETLPRTSSHLLSMFLDPLHCRRRIVVPGEGFEPTRPCGQRILSPLRLPISPTGHVRSPFILRPAVRQRDNRAWRGGRLHTKAALGIG